MLRLFTLVIALSACDAVAADVSFSQQLFPAMQQAGCPACHNANGVASATRLQFPDAQAAPERIEAFGYSLAKLVDRAHPDQSLLLKKPTMRVPHTGGQRIKPGSPEEAMLIAWIQKLASLSDSDIARLSGSASGGEAVAKVPAVTLRRLTHSQYNNTVRDLLGDQSAPARQFPPEDFVNGFKNQYATQNVSPLLEESYSAAAESLAAQAFRGGDARGLVSCKPSVACRDQFIRRFGMRAFRRPLDAAEEKRYAALFATGSSFLKSAHLVVEAMLQSPNFLFRLEDTTNPKWKPYATASRLSYSLWDTMPSAELLDAAAHGDLSTRAGVEKTARRMMEDPRARQALDEFVAQWLRFDRVLTTSRERRRYPNFSRETAVAMTEEARRFVGDLVWGDRNFMDAFTADYGFVNADLASIYRVPAPSKDFDRVSFPRESERGGLIGQALFLALSAKPDDTSLTGRGLFVREQFLCQHVPPPPVTVNTNLPPSTEAHPQTNRERMLEHVNNSVCASCHNLIDPIGYGLEKFDAVGAKRDNYELLFHTAYHGEGKRQPPKRVELPLDTKGWIAGIPNSQFSSPRELGVVLARTPQCQECVIKQYFRYVAGRMETPADSAVIHRAFEDFRESQFRFKEAIISLVCAREFPDDEGNRHVARN